MGGGQDLPAGCPTLLCGRGSKGCRAGGIALYQIVEDCPRDLHGAKKKQDNCISAVQTKSDL